MPKACNGKLKVLFVAWWYPPKDRYEPARGFILRDHVKAAAIYENVNVLVLRPGSRRPGIETYTRSGAGIIDAAPPVTGSGVLDSIAARFFWHRSLALALQKWGRPHVIHSQDRAAYYGVRSASALGVPSVVSQYWSGFARGLISPGERSRFRRAFKAAEMILVSNRHARRDLKKYGVRRKVRWLPPSIDESVFYPSAEGSRNRNLVHVSSFGENEKVESIIDAFALIQAEYPETILHLVGHGGWKAQLEEYARRKLKAGSFSFPGFLNARDRAAVLRNAAGFVYPSVRNYHSIDLLEAMACGCPCITTENALAPVEASRNWAVTVTPGAIDEIATAMRGVLNGTAGINGVSTAEAVLNKYSRISVGRRINQAHLEAIRGKSFQD